MIPLLRALARRFRLILRRCLLASESRPPWPWLRCSAGADGLTLQAQAAEVAVLFSDPSVTLSPPVVLVFQASVLSEFEGRTDDPVELEVVDTVTGRARWTDGGVPRTLDFELATPDRVPALPDLPKHFTPLPPAFAMACHEAVQTTSTQSARLSLSRVQLRGQDGALVATDGKQLLVQTGFPIPWTDAVLVPRLPVFGSRDLAGDDAVAIGRTKKHVVLRVGAWSFGLSIDARGRYPDFETVIPKASRITSRLTIDAADAEFLAATVPKMPGRDDDQWPVTLELSAPPALRARDAGGRVTEVVLARSSASGLPVRLCTDRRLLLRALQLGLRQLQVVNADTPLLARDGHRVYVWMPLDSKGALAPSGDAQLIQSRDAKPPAPLPPTERKAPMPSTNNSPPSPESRNGATPERGGIDEIIAEADALRSMLQVGAVRAARLLAILKQQRRNTRVLRSAIDSLRELQLGP